MEHLLPKFRSRNATEADLKEAFEAHGAVASVAIIKDKLTGDSRGFRFGLYSWPPWVLRLRRDAEQGRGKMKRA